jgi:ubiquinone biosynthesis protein UbiJ
MSAPSPLDARALSQLYLHAVLPCLAELVQSLPVAKTLAARISATVQFEVLGGAAVAITFSEDSVQVTRQRVRGAAIKLIFLSSAHLNAFFRGRKWLLPTLASGWGQLPKISAFIQLSELLEKSLKPSADQLRDSVRRRLYARLTFTAMAGALKPLACHDTLVQKALTKMRSGLAQFTIADEDLHLWMKVNGEKSCSDLGRPKGQPTVEINFRSCEIAVASMTNQLDMMAAMAGGQVGLAGDVPLADGLDVVLARLRDYLQ